VTFDRGRELEGRFKALASRVYACAIGVANGDRDLALDLVQEAFQEAFKRWDEIRDLDDEQLAGWLCQIVINKAVSRFRRNDVARRSTGRLYARQRGNEAASRKRVIARAALERCWQVIEALPEQQRLIAWMRWRDGRSYAEIAEALGISTGAVGSTLSAVRQKIRAIEGLDVFAELDEAEGDVWS
jgi:RNA polymerase sigma factor (sigma-70 family)